jgi:tRNA(Ile2) C34 agmatinyltransferase TiaS
LLKTAFLRKVKMTIEQIENTNEIQLTNIEFNNLIKAGVCPYCGAKMQPDGGCWFCASCGYSVCG